MRDDPDVGERELAEGDIVWHLTTEVHVFLAQPQRRGASTQQGFVEAAAENRQADWELGLLENGDGFQRGPDTSLQFQQAQIHDAEGRSRVMSSGGLSQSLKEWRVAYDCPPVISDHDAHSQLARCRRNRRLELVSLRAERPACDLHRSSARQRASGATWTCEARTIHQSMTARWRSTP